MVKFKSMKPYHVCLLIFLFVAQAEAQITLNECHEKAKANYPLVKQYDLIARSTEYTLANANKAYLPQVSVTGIGAYIFKGLPSITPPGGGESESSKTQLIGIGQINQVLWDGGATRTQKEIIKAGAEVEKSSMDVAMHTLRERINQLYFGILLMDAQLNQLTVFRGNVERNLKTVTLSKNNGLAYQTDIDELKAELINLDQRSIEFKYTRKGFIEMLAYLTAQPFSDTTQFQQPALFATEMQSSISRAELMLYSNQRKLITAQSSLHRVASMPKIGLLGAGVWMEPGMSFGTSTLSSLAIGGISVSWNTAGLYKSSVNKQIDKISLAKISNQEETFLFNTKLQLNQVSADIEKQQAILNSDQQLVQLRVKIRAGYQLKYDNGMSSMNDLLIAMHKENEARSQEALHQVQLQLTLYNYQTISGN